MDIIYFLRRRTAFARSFYEQAARPFAETQRKIERQEAPFDNPPLGEAAGPAYLAEWQEAEESLEMLGQMCLTFLSNSLKLYLYETTGKLSDILGGEFKRLLEGRQRGFPKYEHRFRQVGIDFRYAPVDLALIRQIVETRNLIQHAESISLLHAHQSPAASKKFPRPFFAHPIDKAIAERQPDYTPTTLWVTPGALARAIEAVDAFCQWLDNELWATTRVGVVTKYFQKRKVAVVELAEPVSLGQTLRFRKNDTNFEQRLASMQRDSTSVAVAAAGVVVGIQVEQPVRQGTKVYRHGARSILAR